MIAKMNKKIKMQCESLVCDCNAVVCFLYYLNVVVCLCFHLNVVVLAIFGFFVGYNFATVSYCVSLVCDCNIYIIFYDCFVIEFVQLLHKLCSVVV